MSEHEDNARRFIVIVNHEEQYSIWPSDRPAPTGWGSVGVDGTRVECLAYIEKIWTDMRPLSVREGMEKNPETDGP